MRVQLFRTLTWTQLFLWLVLYVNSVSRHLLCNSLYKSFSVFYFLRRYRFNWVNFIICSSLTAQTCLCCGGWLPHNNGGASPFLKEMARDKISGFAVFSTCSQACISSNCGGHWRHCVEGVAL